MLRKGYFGGGTVAAALADSPFRQLRPETERRLTDGTENFLGILALEVGVPSLQGNERRKGDKEEHGQAEVARLFTSGCECGASGAYIYNYSNGFGALFIGNPSRWIGTPPPPPNYFMFLLVTDDCTLCLRSLPSRPLAGTHLASFRPVSAL